jgi:hypothetical protein
MLRAKAVSRASHGERLMTPAFIVISALIRRSGLPARANLLLFCASCAVVRETR